VPCVTWETVGDMGKKDIHQLDLDQLARLFAVATGGGGSDALEQRPPSASRGDAAGQPKELLSTCSLSTPIEHVGSWVSSYRLISVLGEGGMGMVYLAEQEGPIRRKVALKVIKPGMDSKEVIARFETERQALALLDHPNIAQVFEAGTTEAGRPYFAMEYVKGIPITDYCDRCKLGTQDRLRLFIPLCQAIQHAHHKGIVHRDIKPSNVLVILDDQTLIPKIIDFGVAKALNQRLTERTLFTEQGQFLGTPEYMSPEQAELTGLDVDTRTDIYSLGVLLYELLTGCTPFDPQELRSKGYAEMQRIIREQDPVKPSTKLTTLGGRVEDIAKRHNATAEQLRKSVRGDLDWIVMKAMEKDRTRRYETASGLAQDLERHLDDEPVLARPPSTVYRFQKLVWRNKGVFLGVAAVAAALVIGLMVAGVSLVREQHARRIAVAAQQEETAQRRKAEALAYASDMSLAQEALAKDDLGRARRLLEAHRPTSGELDLRGWEWRYLWRECRSDAFGELCHYPNCAYSVAYSPDGKMLAVAGFGQFFVEIWDVPGRKRIEPPLQSEEGYLVTFSPRGDLLAADGVKEIRVWRTDNWSLAKQLPLAGRVQFLKFSRDGKQLAGLSWPDEATVWEVDQWTIVRQMRGVRPDGYHMGALDFSPDGKALVIGDYSRRLQVVDLASGNTDVNIPKAHPEGITSVAWSPNGSLIASGSGYSGGPIRLWNATSGESLGELEGHTSAIYELVFSTNGLRLYSASGDQTIRIWDVQEKECLATLRGSSDEICGLALSPDGTTLASGCKDGVVAFWSALPRPEEQRPRLIPLGRLGWGAFAPDGQVLAVPREGTVTLLDLVTFREIEQLPKLGSDVFSVIYSPDGTLLVSMERTGKTRVWSCAERRLLRELGDPNAPIYPRGFRADGRRLFSTGAKGKVICWDTLTWQAVRDFVTESHVGGSGISPDGRLLLVGTATGAVHWLNAETGEVLATRNNAHRSLVAAIAFSKDGMRTASVAWDGTLALWDPSSFQPIATFKGHMMGALSVAFYPDGRRLATSSVSREAVRLWDPSTHRELMTLPGQGSNFYAVAFSPDGRWLAAYSEEGQLHLWRAPSWAEIEVAEKKHESEQAP
jgi:WD40 repeat protein/serine/threonine protein kinase